MIERALGAHVSSRLGLGKAVVLLGARQVGKTTLLTSLLGGSSDVLWLNADEARVRSLFAEVTPARFGPYLAGYTTVVIDEAQRIQDIGVKLKILQDAFGPRVQFIATGSSSFDLANKVNEPLTGRKWELSLFPLSAKEMIAHHGLFTEEGFLDSRIVFGWYPEVVSRPELAADLLAELAESTLYKDIFALASIRRPGAFETLVRALAYQVGSQVNLTELASVSGLDRKTVASYVTLLEQAFIVFRVGSYARNLRNELSASSKIYFYDVGLRNALIGDFSPPDHRGDIGHLFENFVVAEMMKSHADKGTSSPCWFWRTTSHQEVDVVRPTPDGLNAYEIKWNPAARVRIPPAFRQGYPDATVVTINRDNVLSILAALT